MGRRSPAEPSAFLLNITALTVILYFSGYVGYLSYYFFLGIPIAFVDTTLYSNLVYGFVILAIPLFSLAQAFIFPAFPMLILRRVHQAINEKLEMVLGEITSLEVSLRKTDKAGSKKLTLLKRKADSAGALAQKKLTDNAEHLRNQFGYQSVQFKFFGACAGMLGLYFGTLGDVPNMLFASYIYASCWFAVFGLYFFENIITIEIGDEVEGFNAALNLRPYALALSAIIILSVSFGFTKSQQRTISHDIRQVAILRAGSDSVSGDFLDINSDFIFVRVGGKTIVIPKGAAMGIIPSN